jgi:hypothetical protein
MRSPLLALLLCAAPLLSGCGSVYYAVSVNAAQSRIEQARQLGAEHHAAFEYYYAREHLRQAQWEATEASYGDAANYAEIAEQYAQKAIDLSAAAKRGEGSDK